MEGVHITEQHKQLEKVQLELEQVLAKCQITSMTREETDQEELEKEQMEEYLTSYPEGVLELKLAVQETVSALARLEEVGDGYGAGGTRAFWRRGGHRSRTEKAGNRQRVI